MAELKWAASSSSSFVECFVSGDASRECNELPFYYRDTSVLSVYLTSN
jgi:hypothetical protein